mmetsp:Transcript_31988/g.95546  ORF Transcript_31988/g.95546 Transcript_31988/m.95546 type:complete len:202 (-) Transcript_31988:282-887(-)
MQHQRQGQPSGNSARWRRGRGTNAQLAIGAAAIAADTELPVVARRPALVRQAEAQGVAHARLHRLQSPKLAGRPQPVGRRRPATTAAAMRGRCCAAVGGPSGPAPPDVHCRRQQRSQPKRGRLCAAAAARVGRVGPPRRVEYAHLCQRRMQVGRPSGPIRRRRPRNLPDRVEVLAGHVARLRHVVRRAVASCVRAARAPVL